MTIPPTILLVRPQMGENIGAAARVMANFGLSQLALVAPRDGWPNPKAADMAAKALPLIDDAQVFDTTNDALADYQFVLATSARERAMHKPHFYASEAMEELRERAARGERCAILFGPERTGLENEDIALADAIVSIPVTAEYASLNLAQAVAVMCYEWKRVPGDRCEVTDEQNTSHLPPVTRQPLATRAELSGFFDQFEAALDCINFWRVPEKKEGMWLNIRAMLLRAGMTSAEVATWRGIIKGLREE